LDEEAGPDRGPVLKNDQDSNNHDMKNSETDCKETARVDSEKQGSPTIPKIRPRVSSLEIYDSDGQLIGSLNEKKVNVSLKQVVTQDKEKFCDLLERDHKNGTPEI
jgi:hypothetical protein